MYSCKKKKKKKGKERKEKKRKEKKGEDEYTRSDDEVYMNSPLYTVSVRTNYDENACRRWRVQQQSYANKR
ncbi:hypothetical protein POVCU1_038010 [Plasmodium ovale curtisi]|uniref:Uncharacterized protein n=1 Tax=Plasmodium ovale curtisi TaxID=864141 RepID=A0A1A8WYG8_PLAOA|nr:hypothetical protein POVCU1_038010 [Plasmodium ovale curtisi]